MKDSERKALITFGCNLPPEEEKRQHSTPHRRYVGAWLLDLYAARREITSWESIVFPVEEEVDDFIDGTLQKNIVTGDVIIEMAKDSRCVLAKIWLPETVESCSAKQKAVQQIGEFKSGRLIQTGGKNIQDKWYQRRKDGCLPQFGVYEIGLNAPGRLHETSNWNDQQFTSLQMNSINEKRDRLFLELDEWINS